MNSIQEQEASYYIHYIMDGKHKCRPSPVHSLEEAKAKLEYLRNFDSVVCAWVYKHDVDGNPIEPPIAFEYYVNLFGNRDTWRYKSFETK